MREIKASTVTKAVRDLCIEANTELPESHLKALRRALGEEESPRAGGHRTAPPERERRQRQVRRLLPITGDNTPAVVYHEPVPGEGTGTLLADRVKEAGVVAYEDLGSEAIRRLVVEDFPVVVINDLRGGDLYREGRERWRRSAG